jgi:hypothetical protein
MQETVVNKMKNIILLAASNEYVDNQPNVNHLPIVLHRAAQTNVTLPGQKVFDGVAYIPQSTPWRLKHLETVNGTPLITRLIERCTIKDTNLYVAIHPRNFILINHIKACHPSVKIVHPPEETMYSTYETVLDISGDSIMVEGDLVGVRYGDVNKFVSSPHYSAVCRGPVLEGGLWEQHWRSWKGNIKRVDLGPYITMIGESHKEEFLKGYDNLREYFDEFGGFGGIYTRRPDEGKRVPFNSENFNSNKNWHVGSCMVYTFFKKIFSNPQINTDGDKGTVYFDHFIGQDNDC